MSERVLLVGSSFSAVPIFEALKSFGYDVHVVGGYSDDPCHQYADQSHIIDYRNQHALQKVFEESGASFICPSCNDYSYLSSAYVAAEKKLPGFDAPDVISIIHNKNLFRKFCIENGLPSPKMFLQDAVVEEEYDALNYPVLVKPTDSFSGKGIVKVSRREELSNAVDYARRQSGSGEAVVEEFVEGALHSVSVFLVEGSVRYSFFVDEFCTVYEYQVNCSNIPSSLAVELQSQVLDDVAAICKRLSLVDGLLHIQFIAQGERFWFIEAMRRAPGDLYYHLIKRATGFDGMSAYASPFVGRDIPDVEVEEASLQARHTISTLESASVSSFSISPGSYFDLEIFSLKSSGYFIEPAPNDKLGLVFMGFRDPDDLYVETPRLANYIKLNSGGLFAKK